MASPEPENGNLPVVDPATPVCRHLRNKGMYVYTDGQGEGDPEDDAGTIYWCNLTLKSFGPDDEYVSRDECRIGSWSCYEPF
jgi:hypothetical protein